MTHLYYNGILLRDCQTESFDQKIEYDESGTDVMFSRFRIRVSSTLVSFVDDYPVDHPRTLRPDSALPTNGTLTQRIRRVQTLLGQKGGLFYFYTPHAPGSGDLYAQNQHSDMILMAVGAVLPTGLPVPETILKHPDDPEGPAIYANSLVDCNNGPHPIGVKVKEIFGGRSMRVEFEIEVCRKLCDPATPEDPYPSTEPYVPAVEAVEAVEDDPETPEDETVEGVEGADAIQISPSSLVLSNRWYVEDSKDASWATTRVLQGTLRVTDKRTIPHLMRFLVVPPLMNGYQRVSQYFADDPTGLVLKYRIEDRERHASPPAPAVDWLGEYVESSGEYGISNQISSLHVKLIGPPGVDKQELIGAAGKVINARISGLQRKKGVATASKSILLETVVTESLAEPVISMRVRVKHHEDQTQLRVRLDKIGTPLDGDSTDNIDGYKRRSWPVPLAYDSETPAGILSCYLQRPCSRWHGVVAWPEAATEDATEETDSSDEPETPYPVVPSEPDANPSLTRREREDQLARDDENRDGDARYYSSESVFDDDDTVISSEQSSSTPYTFLCVRSRYVTDHGWASIPLATTDPAAAKTVEQIRLHAGVSKRILEVEASRLDTPPKLPMPVDDATDTNGIREVLTDSAFESLAPAIQADGVTREYRLLARYEYSLSRPLKEDEKMRLAISPVDATDDETRLLDMATVFDASKYV